MIAYARLLVLLSWRGTGGRSLLLGAAVGPLLFGIAARSRLDLSDFGRELDDAEKTVLLALAVVASSLISAAGVGQRLVHAVSDERLDRRSRLLVSAGLDAGRAALALVLFGSLFATLLAATAVAAFALTLSGLGLSAGSWLRAGLVASATGLFVTPPAVLAGLRLPRNSALVLTLSGSVALAVHAAYTGPWLAGRAGADLAAAPCSTVLVGPLALLAALLRPRRILRGSWP